MDASVVIPPYVAGPFRLEPFAALRLDPARIGDPATARLYARPYRGVAARLRAWQDQGHLVHDASAALYVHEYSDSGLTVAGVVGALDITRRTQQPLEAAVLPHEGVHPAQVRELANRMAQMQLNPAPILLVQDYPEVARRLVTAVRAEQPDHAFIDRGGQGHRIWAIRDRDLIDELNEAWSSSRSLLADGHHRYAAYLRVQSSAPGGPADLGLAMVVDQGATPLHLGAIHRTLTRVSLADLRTAADRLGLTWRSAPHGEAVAALGAATMVLTDGTEWASLNLRAAPDQAAADFLHRDLLPALPRSPSRIRYHHSVEEALHHVRQSHDTAVLLPAPTTEHVWRSVLAGRLLPEKTTSFQPKPSPGVLIRSLRA